MTTPSPLQEIEHLVQERARDLTLDADREPDVLRSLVVDTVAQWSVDHKRGIRPFDLADPAAVVERAVRNLSGYGPLEELLADEDVWEIMINAPAEIFVKRHSGPSGYHHEVFHDDAHVVRTLTKILSDASGAHRKLDPTEGLQDAQLDDGSRLHIVHGDIGFGGHVMVNIRRFTNVAFHDLTQLVDRGMLTADAARFLAGCVRAKSSIVFAGAPGFGQDHHAFVLLCRAGPEPAGGGGRRGVRGRYSISERGKDADPPRPR
jgi:pilus assembly protein CpaF